MGLNSPDRIAGKIGCNAIAMDAATLDHWTRATAKVNGT